MTYADNKRRVVLALALAIVVLLFGVLLGSLTSSSQASGHQLTAAQRQAHTAKAALASTNHTLTVERAAAAASSATVGRLQTQIANIRGCLTPHHKAVSRCLHQALR